jgi:hypothetical protein
MANAAEEVLVHLLKTDALVQALVGEVDQFRICPDLLPAKWRGKSAIVYEQQGDKRQHTLAGPTGLIHSRFKLYCVHRSRIVSRQLAQAARDALHNKVGDYVGVTVRQVFVPDGEQDESVPADDGNEQPERSRTIEAIVHYLQPTETTEG